MKVDLAGRTAIVAGSAGDLGEALSALLADNGAVVEAIADPDPALLSAAINRGTLDILVNVAPDARDESPARLDHFCRTAAQAMGRGGGRILNIVSVLGVIPARGEGAAGAASAAVLALTRSLALEFGERGILVNALAVGPWDGDAALAERLLSHTPLARPARVEEIAAAALFLLDPDNSYTTGHVMVVDGGWTAGFARDF